jgi:signal transduction histidine kinase
LFSLIGLGALGLFHVHILGLMRHVAPLGRTLRVLATVLVASGLLMFATPWTHGIHRVLYGTNLSSGMVLVSMALGLAGMVLRTFKGDRTARALLLVTLPTLLVIAAAFVTEILPDSGLLQHRGLLIELFLAIETCGITLILSLAVNRERRVHAELLQRHLDLESSFVDRIAHEADRHLKGTAMDLHDGVGQSIASLRMRLHAELAGSEPEAVRRIDAGMAELAKEVRDTARRMYPPELHDGDLEAPLRRLLEGVPVRWIRSEDIAPFSEQEAYQIYRSLQEALRNALDHGKARSIDLELHPDRIRFHDDGRGLDTGAPQGLGMRSIRQRMAEIGWSAQWTSGSTGGCTLELRRGPGAPGGSVLRIPLSGQPQL